MATAATFFELAAAGDKQGVARQLMSGFADINSATRDGFTALHFAVQEGHIDLVDFLIENEADVNRKSVAGATPIFMVILAPQDTQIALTKKLLLSHASLSVRNSQGVPANAYLQKLGSEALRDWIELQRSRSQRRR